MHRTFGAPLDCPLRVSNVGTSIEMIENYYGHLRNRNLNVVSEITKASFIDKPSSKVDFLYE